MSPESIASRSDLIYDVGMHRGEDTEFYLAQGFHVLAIEADPILAEKARLRFREEIDSGRLTILNIGISDRDSIEEFWICDDKSEWNSFDRQSASRNGCRTHPMDVHTRRFDGILREFGIPVYLKIDIEGKDSECLEALRNMPLPKFISAENQWSESINEVPSTLKKLNSLGYRYFNLVEQANFRPLFRPLRIGHRRTFLDQLLDSLARRRLRIPVIRHLAEPFSFQAQLLRRNGGREFLQGSSGPWGIGIPGGWVTFDKACSLYPRVLRKYLSAENPDPVLFWCDWHATVEIPVGSKFVFR